MLNQNEHFATGVNNSKLKRDDVFVVLVVGPVAQFVASLVAIN